MPAWVERAGVRSPLAPGMLLQPGDVLHTGAQSRLQVRLAERSLVKLGENGQLRFTELSPVREMFRAALGVLQGAFRFTTDLAVKNRRREVRISVGTVTTGIRGTDLWGRAQDDSEIVCLIEGAIEVTAPGETPVAMDQPLQFYRRLAGQTQPVGFVEPARLAQWAQQTDLQPGQGAARAGGRFQVELARPQEQDAALAIYDKAREAGFAAEISPVREGEQLIYRVLIRNLASRADAQALAARLRGQFGIDNPTVL